MHRVGNVSLVLLDPVAIICHWFLKEMRQVGQWRERSGSNNNRGPAVVACSKLCLIFLGDVYLSSWPHTGRLGCKCEPGYRQHLLHLCWPLCRLRRRIPVRRHSLWLHEPPSPARYLSSLLFLLAGQSFYEIDFASCGNLLGLSMLLTASGMCAIPYCKQALLLTVFMSSIGISMGVIDTGK